MQMGSMMFELASLNLFTIFLIVFCAFGFIRLFKIYLED